MQWPVRVQVCGHGHCLRRYDNVIDKARRRQGGRIRCGGRPGAGRAGLERRLVQLLSVAVAVHDSRPAAGPDRPGYAGVAAKQQERRLRRSGTTCYAKRGRIRLKWAGERERERGL